jgi:uncharacterized membrane protein YcgQ (UPF0703/DUF1980 family)
MTQRKQPKGEFKVMQPSYRHESQYSNDMFRGEHPCDFTDKQWVYMMRKLYPNLGWKRYHS